jgi:hypothetical protein
VFPDEWKDRGEALPPHDGRGDRGGAERSDTTRAEQARRERLTPSRTPFHLAGFLRLYELLGSPAADRVPPVILVGEFSPDPQGPPYGFMQTFDLSALPPVALTNFDLLDVERTIVVRSDGGRTVVPLTRAPRRCDGYWEYASTYLYASGDSLTATSRQPCVGRPGKPTKRR